MSCNYRNREKVRSVQFFFFNQCNVFGRAKFKSNVYFRRLWPENLDNPEFIPGLSRVTDTASGFSSCRLRCDSLRAARRFTSSHAACNRCYRAAQSFALVLNNQLDTFCGHKNSETKLNFNITLELISNWTPKIILVLIQLWNPRQYIKMPIFLDYRRFPVPLDRNNQNKNFASQNILTLKKVHFGPFCLFFVMVI